MQCEMAALQQPRLVINARWAAPSAGNQLYAAHCGDTRAVMSRNGEALRLTEDHKPNLPRERKRVEVRLCWMVVHCPTTCCLVAVMCTRLRAARTACCGAAIVQRSAVVGRHALHAAAVRKQGLLSGWSHIAEPASTATVCRVTACRAWVAGWTLRAAGA